MPSTKGVGAFTEKLYRQPELGSLRSRVAPGTIGCGVQVQGELKSQQEGLWEEGSQEGGTIKKRRVGWTRSSFTTHRTARAEAGADRIKPPGYGGLSCRQPDQYTER